MCSRFVSTGGDRGSPVIQEAISDDFSARKDGDRGGDVAMVGANGWVVVAKCMCSSHISISQRLASILCTSSRVSPCQGQWT
jgi:hypothetical protein